MVRCGCPCTSNIKDSVRRKGVDAQCRLHSRLQRRLPIRLPSQCYQRSLEIDFNQPQTWNDLGVRGGGIIGGETRDVAKYLVTAGADVNAADTNGATPLYLAAVNGHLDVAKYLVTAGADLNAATRTAPRRCILLQQTAILM